MTCIIHGYQKLLQTMFNIFYILQFLPDIYERDVNFLPDMYEREWNVKNKLA